MDKKFGIRLTKGYCTNNDDDDSHSESESRAQEVAKSALVKSISFLGLEIAINVGNPAAWQIIKWDDGSKDCWEQYESERNTGCPSKFLIMCLNSIQNATQQKNIGDRPLFANAWGLEFWNCYSNGNDVLDINGGGDSSSVEKIGWITSTAADTISMKEKDEGLSFNGPFLLYLVPSKDKAYKVREICKHLEVVGIRTVCLHSGASIDHQIHSLKSYEPEFVVSTPERLLELLSLKAVDISEVFLMVVDGLESPPFKGGATTTYFDAVQSIRQFISGNPQTIVFCHCK